MGNAPESRAARRGAARSVRPSSFALGWVCGLALVAAVAFAFAVVTYPRTPRARVALPAVAGLSAAVDGRGLAVTHGAARARLDTVAVGRGQALEPVTTSGAPDVVDHVVELARGLGLTEWWRAVGGGVEHGYRVESRLGGAGDLVVELRVSGDLTPSVHDGHVVLSEEGGVAVMAYDTLHVVDALGRAVPARLEAGGDRVRIVVDDAGARYPLVIDPLLHALEATVYASDAAADDAFGSDVALSADGTRAVVGARLQDQEFSGNGAAYVFTRVAGVWTEEQRLLAPDRSSGHQFGANVTMDATGSRLAVAAPVHDNPSGTPTTDSGAVYVYVRVGASWTLEQQLGASARAGFDRFGSDVSLDADGNTLVVGADGDDEPSGVATSDSGAAYVFTRVGSAWTEATTLFAPDRESNENFGSSVAVSGDGTRVVVGARQEDDSTGTATMDNGAAYVFVGSGGSFSHERKLLAPDKGFLDQFGGDVAIDATGTRILVGAINAGGSMFPGAAYIFVRSGTAWSLEQQVAALDGLSSDGFGSSVALDASGSRALIGAYADDQPAPMAATNTGSGYVFLRSGSSWQQAQKLLAPTPTTDDVLGLSCALDGVGSVAVFGGTGIDRTAPTATANVGAVIAFGVGLRGAPCTDASECASGACVDDVCCESACSGVLDDCVACRRALTGVADGTCAPLALAVAPGVTCRAAADGCDAAEVCVPGDPVCPADARVAAGEVCRVAAGPCDAAERCDGASVACPADAFQVGGTCRLGVGACDRAESCDGTQAACPADGVRPADTICRASMGACDPVEVCDGLGKACPGDARQQAGTVCRDAAGGCDVVEVCDGTAPDCPGDGFAAAATVCRAATSFCDADELCDGQRASCPQDEPRPDGTPCDDGLVCTQASACLGGVCASTATLDCSDPDPCTTDGCVEPSGCRHVAVPACLVDAGQDASSAPDAADADAGSPPTPQAAGCSCRVASRGSADVVIPCAVLGWTIARRRRRPRRSSCP